MPEELTEEEWAAAIIIAYESGKGLTDDAKKELAQRLSKDRATRSKIREILIQEGYGPVLGLS
ncbi:MAG: hypothetical protein HZB70_03145 [Candidatus Berkelbacteria bacterium]|nr:MAG: hypothetical protein HZB70_03145 [Candidatus Berkelbacteria bacterium]QQG51703.1 MAG: hypothetical protein HY845_04045 [Candidatus Berkelbacteria bacterium]